MAKVKFKKRDCTSFFCIEILEKPFLLSPQIYQFLPTMFTCLKFAMETPEQCVNSVQSKQ